MQVCTLFQTDNHASTSPLSFLQAGCLSCRPTNSVKALKACVNSDAKMTVFKVTLKVAAPGVESAVSDCLVAVGDVCLVFVQQNVLLPFRSHFVINQS